MVNLELGNIAFNTNINQTHNCPNYIISFLDSISNVLSIKMWNKYQEEYDSPFDNTGNKYKNDVFEVEAYNWDDDYEQPYNFKYKDVEISWYKYCGRDTTINKEVSPDEAIKMFNDCLDSLQNIDDMEEII